MIQVANSIVDICNLALSRCRTNNIGAFTDVSPQAEQCRIFYPEARNFVLSKLDWPFNRKTIVMALKAYTPAEWTYAYAYPNDCIFVRRLLPGKDSPSQGYQSTGDRFDHFDQYQVDYSVEMDDTNKQVIVTNQPEARLIYSAKVEDVSQFGQMVTELVAWRMAGDLAIKFGGDNGMRYRRDAQASFGLIFSEASAAYLNQGQPRQRQTIPASIRGRTSRSSNSANYRRV